MNAIAFLKHQHRELERLLNHSRASSGSDRIRLLGETAEALALHMTIEERHLYPMMRDQGMAEAADRSVANHGKLRELVAAMLEMKRSDPRLPQALEQVDHLARQHINEEEQRVLPQFERAAPPGSLDALGGAMERSLGDLADAELLLSTAQDQDSPAP